MWRENKLTPGSCLAKKQKNRSGQQWPGAASGFLVQVEIAFANRFKSAQTKPRDGTLAVLKAASGRKSRTQNYISGGDG
jgi:hypothetical protein